MPARAPASKTRRVEIQFRATKNLRTRIQRAARADGRSANDWLVRAVTAHLDALEAAE